MLNQIIINSNGKSVIIGPSGRAIISTTINNNNLYPNLPNGMSLITRIDGTDETPSGWFTDATFATKASIEPDGGGIVNPYGSGSWLKIQHTSGETESGALSIDDFGADYNELYFIARIWFESGWVMNRKLFYFGNGDTGGIGPTEYFITRELDHSMSTQIQWSGRTDHFTEPAGPGNNYISGFWSGEDNKWSTLEMYVAKESSAGAGDGTARIWLNGTLMSNRDGDVQWSDSDELDAIIDFNGAYWYNSANAPGFAQTKFMGIGEFAVFGKD